MKHLLCTLLIISSLSLKAQNNITALIHAERSFASFTVANGIKKGFLQFLDSNGVVFPAGDAVNGLTLYSKNPGGAAQLNWGPEYAVISASGDFGFTTGPYHLRRSANDTISGRGQYNSIWHINKDGQWKVLADMGNRYNDDRTIPNTAAELDLKKAVAKTFSLEDITTLDQQLNTSLKEKGSAAFQPFLGAQSWFNVNNHAPSMGARNIGDLLKTITVPDNFQYVNSGIASSKDLAYTYGKTTTGPYMRVWTKQSSGWILLLQVIGG